jgi:membrane protein
MNGVRRWGGMILKVERRFRGDDALMMAAALSYTSLLSVVPLLAVGLAILAAFPAFESARIQIQLLLVQNLAPEVGQQVRGAIAGFIGNAGNLTAIGIVGLVVTALLLLVNIEDALNRIFRVTKPRAPMSRLIIYWTMVTLGPLLLGASLSITDWLFGGASDDSIPVLSAVLGLLSLLFHFIMLVALLTLLYSTVPHRVVPFRRALSGALLAGVAIALLRFGFHVYVADLKPYQSVYGALAAVPILLFWAYLVWVAVLVGAELTACLMEEREEGITPSPPSS